MKLPSKLPWIVEVDGEDLVVRNIKVTCFGGADDPEDNGKTESGIPNDGRDPKLMGIALPIRSTEAATSPSPLAFKGKHIPWGTHVWVWREVDGPTHGVDCVLIDNGPNVAKFPEHALDVNPNVAHFFSPSIDKRRLAKSWSGVGFSYRVIGGAQYVDKVAPAPVKKTEPNELKTSVIATASAPEPKA